MRPPTILDRRVPHYKAAELMNQLPYPPPGPSGGVFVKGFSLRQKQNKKGLQERHGTQETYLLNGIFNTLLVVGRHVSSLFDQLIQMEA